MRENKDYDSYYEFKDCKTPKEYRQKYLGVSPFEDVYQLAYDMSNDWFLNTPTWQDVQNAFILGTKMSYPDIRCDYDIVLYNKTNQTTNIKKCYNMSFDDIYKVISEIDDAEYAYQLYRVPINKD